MCCFRSSLRGTLDAALQLQPATKRVVAIIGVSPWEQFWESESRRLFREYEPRMRFEYLVGVPLPELIERVRDQPRDALVLYEVLFRDKDGNSHVAAEIAGEIASASSLCPLMGSRKPISGGELLVAR
jgi:hypothetical protein